MGLKNLPTIVQRLRSEGKSADTPVALVRWGTRPNQLTVVGTLTDIVQKAAEHEIEPPAIIIIGEVVRLRDQLNWFETRPLFGKRILVTRPRDQAPELCTLLEGYGAETVGFPMIEIIPPENWHEMDQAIEEIHQFQWLVFTSVNGIEPFMERLRNQGRDVRVLSGLRICCIGPRTAQELDRYGLRPDVIPSEFQAEGLVDALKAAGVTGQRVLISRAAVARQLLQDQLRELGCDVRIITAYRTILPATDKQKLDDLLRNGLLNVITFTSSSTVVNFVKLFDRRSEMLELLKSVIVACIGPITARTAKDEGLSVAIMPCENTVPALVDAIVEYFSTHN
jgi:uroporphyrinogen III methyltransferase/synthase